MKKTGTQESATGESGGRRKHRSRPTPKWLAEQKDLDEMARRRCLMLLSVLSGEQPVTDAIVSANISRGTYYQLEERALRAMLTALSPGGETAEGLGQGATARIAQLEKRVAELEREKRRSERLLLLTRKLVRPGPMASGVGRPRKLSSSSNAGLKRLQSSKSKASTRARSTPESQASSGPKAPVQANPNSTLTRDGEGEP